MNRTLFFCLLAALLAGCPSANDDDSAVSNDDDAANDDDATSDDDDATSDDDDATSDDDDATGDDDDATSDDDDATGDDDDSTSTGGACSQNADHNLVVTIDPSTMTSQTFMADRYFFSAEPAGAGTAVAIGDTVGLELAFDPPLLPSRLTSGLSMTFGWSGAVGTAQGEPASVSGAMSVPALPTDVLPTSAITGLVYPVSASAGGLALQIDLSNYGPDHPPLECVSAQYTVAAHPADPMAPAVPNVGADVLSVAASCSNSYCPPDLLEGGALGDDDDSASGPDDGCDMWADNVFEITLSASDFVLSNDGSTNGVLRYDADFTDFGISAPTTDQSYAFIAHFTDPVAMDGDWDNVQLYFDNTYPTINNASLGGGYVEFTQMGTTDLQVTSTTNAGQTNGSALEWVPKAWVEQSTAPPASDPDQIDGALECIAFGLQGDGNMLGINVAQPPNVTPMSRFTIRGDCLGSGATCGSNTLDFSGATVGGGGAQGGPTAN